MFRPAPLFFIGLVALLPLLGMAQTTEPVFPGKVQSTQIPPEFNDPETHLRIHS